MVNDKSWLTPFNTGKIKIGALYVPQIKPNVMGKDAFDLQTALLHRPKPLSPTMRRIKNILTAVNKWRMK